MQLAQMSPTHEGDGGGLESRMIAVCRACGELAVISDKQPASDYR
jgi:hypothetical protein